MTQKRFLTAAEVFQLFGVDADGLDRLIESGEVTALPDQGTFKYRREDFANLVKKGKLVPRTSGELFKADAKGDLPFLKIQNEDQGLKFGEKVEFLELDEEALEEQARQEKPALRTPVVSDKWFDDSDDSAEIPQPFSLSNPETSSVKDVSSADDATDLELNISKAAGYFAESDSDVRIFGDDADIDLDGHGQQTTGSDSDVRLVGPVSSSGSAQLRGKPMAPGDSEIRLVKQTKSAPQSDSDVTLLTSVIEPSAHFNAPANAPLPPAATTGKKPGTDSDVQLVTPSASTTETGKSETKPAKTASVSPESDSDVVLAGQPTEVPPLIPVKTGKKPDSDSDVRLSNPPNEATEANPDNVAERLPFEAETAGNPDLDFGDSNIRLEAPREDVLSPSTAPEFLVTESDDDSLDSGIEIEVESIEPDIVLETADDEDAGIVIEEDEQSDPVDSDLLDALLDDDGASSETIDLIPNAELESSHESEHELSGEFLTTPTTDRDISIEVEATADDLGLDLMNSDSGVSLEKTEMDLGLAPVPTPDDSDVTMEFTTSGEVPVLDTFEEGSGITLEKTYIDSENSTVSDSDITMEIASSSELPVLEPFDEESGITVEPETDDSGIQLIESDSGVRFESMGDSEIALGGDDSGITLDDGDSGIMLEQGDSGISLTPADSGITLEGGESGISLGADDSGIALDAEDDLAGTFADHDVLEFASDSDVSKQTQKFDSSRDSVKDSGFDVSLAEGDHTMELDAEESEFDLSDAAATVAESEPKRKKGKKSLDLSEAFQLDEPPEVEDLDISDDLDSAGDEYLEDFAEAEEEALDVSDDAFNAEGILAAVDEDDASHKSAARVTQKKIVPTGPSFDILDTGLVTVASLAMAATMTALLGGIATMWTGDEAAGPVAMVISNLAGLSPW